MDAREASLRKQLTYRPPHYHPDFPLVLLWSPKSGCTTLLKWFLYQIGQLEQAERYNSWWVHDYEFNVYKKYPQYYDVLLRTMMTSQKETVKLVRNPYTRAVSSFLVIATLKNKLYDGVRAQIAGHPGLLGMRGEGITFRRFLTYLLIEGADVDRVNTHFATQYIEGEERYVTRYIYLERLAADLRALEKRHRLRPGDIAALSKSSHHASGSMRHVGKYADVNLYDSAFPHFPTVDSFYDDETEALVRAVYRRDFQTYGYHWKRR